MAGRQPLPDLHPENKGALGPFWGLPACPRSAVMAQPSSIFSFVHSLFILKHTFILEGDADVHNVVTLIRWLCLLSLQPCFNKSRVHPRSLPLPVVRGLCRLGGRARAGHNAFCVQTRNLGLEGLLPGARPGLCMVVAARIRTQGSSGSVTVTMCVDSPLPGRGGQSQNLRASPEVLRLTIQLLRDRMASRDRIPA